MPQQPIGLEFLWVTQDPIWSSVEELHRTACQTGWNGSQQLTLKNVQWRNEGLKWAISADEEGQNHFGLPRWE